MGIDLNPKLVETAMKITVTKNEYNDTVYGTTSSSACLYRDISSLKQYNNRNDIMIDGLLWFGPDENVSRGDIYYHPSEGYLKIIKVIKAKRLVADNSLQFIKCEVARHRQVS